MKDTSFYDRQVNTTERKVIIVRPVVADLALAIEASFARHDDGTPPAGRFTGNERAYRFLNRLVDDARLAAESVHIAGATEETISAIVRSGAWTALSLMCAASEAADGEVEA